MFLYLFCKKKITKLYFFLTQQLLKGSESWGLYEDIKAAYEIALVLNKN